MAGALKIVIGTYKGADVSRPMVDGALRVLNGIVNSPEFRTEVESYRGYRYADGLTSNKIYNRLMTGDPHGDGDLGAGRTVSFDYEIINGESGSVIGYRNEGTNDIFTYAKRLAEMDEKDLASHLCHEVVGHLAGGFGHPMSNWRGRGRSVPYVIDDIVDRILEHS